MNKKNKLEVFSKNLGLLGSRIGDSLIRIFFPSILILWYIFLIIQLIYSLINQDYSMYPLYIQVNLMLFGFTFLGSIFNRLGRLEKLHIKRKLWFKINLAFLLSTIGFLFVYSMMNRTFLTADVGETLSLFFAIVIMIFYTVAIISMIVGVSGLFTFLRDYYKEIDEELEKD